MGQAILYCSGCSTQLRDRDFEKGAALRWEGRAYCSQCAPAEARSSAPLPLPTTTPPPSRRVGDETNRNLKAVPAPGPPRRVDSGQRSPKILIIAGGGVLALVVMVVVAMSGKDPVRPPVDPPPAPAPPDPAPTPAPTPPPPSGNEHAAEDALRKARDFAQGHPDDLAGQLALFDAAVRASENTGHAVTAAREREAVVQRQKQAAVAQLEALDAALRAAADKEEFGAAFKLVEEARQKPMTPEWPVELEARTKSVHEAAAKLFEPLKKQAAEARKKGAEDEVKKVTQRVDKWGVDLYRSELAKAVAAATPKPKPPAPAPPKEIDLYRKRWGEAMALAAGRDYAGAIRRIEEYKPATPDPAAQAEAAADLELLKLAQAAADDALQTLAKTAKGQKLTLSAIGENGLLGEISGTVLRADAQEIDLAREKGAGPVPVGEVAARSLAQLVRGRRDPKGLAAFCAAEGDAEGGRSFLEPPAVLPDKYWAHADKMLKTPSPSEAAARRLYYVADRESLVHAKACAATQRFAALLKDHEGTPFVRRNRALIAARAEGIKEFFFAFEDLKAGGGFKAAKNDRDETYWRLPAEGDPAKAADNFVELDFGIPAETELHGWAYVGGCCLESVTFSILIGEAAEPAGEPRTAKPTLSMPFRTHDSHAGRGRPTPKWGWVPLPLPKFSTAGLKRVRLISSQQNFCVGEVFLSATRQVPPTAAELKDLERSRADARASGRVDFSLVGWWKMNDGAGATAADSSFSGLNGTLQNGATWAAGTTTPWNPPSVKLAGNAFVNLGNNIPILQNSSAVTLSAWINLEKLGTDKDLFVIIGISRFSGTPSTPDSRATLYLTNLGTVTLGGRSLDQDKGQILRTADKPVKAGVWTHVAGVIDYPANTMAIYVNGVGQSLAGTPVKFGAKATPNTPSTCGALGAEDDGSKSYFPGRLADVRIYNRALGKDEIAELAVPGASIR